MKPYQWLLAIVCITSTAWADRPVDDWTNEQWTLIESMHLQHRPTLTQDSSNAVLHEPIAIELGQQLFSDRSLSRDGTVSCAHCHQAKRGFTDGLQHALGLQAGSRNTPSLLNTGYQRWFFWDGRADSLWAQALGPLENPNEHGLTRIQAVQIVSDNTAYRKTLLELFGQWPTPAQANSWPTTATPLGKAEAISSWKTLPREERAIINRSFSQIGKVIAAHVATLRSRETAFDRYVSAIARGVEEKGFGEKEKRGLALFISEKGGCSLCHSGPLLSNGEFQNTGTGIRNVDSGRSEVVEEIRWDRFNCLGEFSDAPKTDCDELRYMNRNRHEQYGSFKVPSLRNVANTGPYMHDGRYTTLQDAIRHYSQVSSTNLDTHLPRIALTDDDIDAITAFLNTLSDTTSSH